MPRRPTGSLPLLDATSRPVAFRGGTFTPRNNPVAGLTALVVIVLLWELASARGWVSRIFLPSPWETAKELKSMVMSGEPKVHLAASLSRLVAGYVIGMSSGILVGLSLGLFTLTRSAGIALVSALFSIPKIALLPLFILWFGIG